MQHLLRVGRGVHDQSTQHVGPDGMQSEHEPRDDAEVAAAAPDRPEEVRMLGRARAHEIPGCGHDLGRLEVVDGEAVLAAEPAEAAAEREPRDSGRGIDPERRGQAMRLGRGVEIGEQSPGLDGGPATSGVDLRTAHAGQVEDQPALAGGEARHVVPSPANREREAVIASEDHTPYDVRRVGGPRDDRRAPVDHSVPEAPSLVIGWVSRPDQVPMPAPPKGRQAAGIDRGGGTRRPHRILQVAVGAVAASQAITNIRGTQDTAGARFMTASSSMGRSGNDHEGAICLWGVRLRYGA
jgi:hypothetical protein